MPNDVLEAHPHIHILLPTAEEGRDPHVLILLVLHEDSRLVIRLL